MKAKTIKTKRIVADVPNEFHIKFHSICEKKFGNKGSATKVLRKLMHKYMNGEIDI